MQRAFDTLKQIAFELRIVQESLEAELAQPSLAGDRRSQFEITRANSEKTYLLRLLAEFEGALDRIGPTLYRPCPFTDDDGLKGKLDRIGKNMGMASEDRSEFDEKLRKHRNELAHGKSPILRVSFEDSLELMKGFLRACR